jgi:hypothetical protein
VRVCCLDALDQLVAPALVVRSALVAHDVVVVLRRVIDLLVALAGLVGPRHEARVHGSRARAGAVLDHRRCRGELPLRLGAVSPLGACSAPPQCRHRAFPLFFKPSKSLI